MASEAADGTVPPGDQVGLLRDLEASDRFIRDTTLGRMFHSGTGKVSYREAVREKSLHIVIDGNHISAHIDSVSPLVFADDGTVHYSVLRDVRYVLPRVVAHNLASLAEMACRAIGGKWNAHRCELLCERVEMDDTSVDHYLDACGEESPAADGVALDDAAIGTELRRQPFNVIDEAVHLLDTRASPWSVQLEVRVAGRLDQDRLAAALATALGRHPRARARKSALPNAEGHDEWEVTGKADVDVLDVVDCPDDAALTAARERLQSTRVPLETSPPLRARLARHPGGDVLMLNLNHAATDGFGGLRLLQSIGRAYRGEPDPVADDSPLDDRTLPVRLGEAGSSTKLRRYLALAERLRDVTAPPARIAPAVESPPPAEGGYGFRHVSLGEAETRRVTEGERLGSVNDVLVAALHLAVADWNGRRQAPCRRVTVLTPSNLRPPRWRDEVVGNFSLPARITTTPRQRSSPAVALRAVVAQTRRKKRTGMGTALLELLGQSQRVPLSAKRAMMTVFDRSGDRLVDTVILSNLGSVDDPPAFGEDAGETAELWFSAPGRLPLGLSVGAVTVSGRLHLVFRYDRQLFDDAAADQFARDYLDWVRGVTSVTSR